MASSYVLPRMYTLSARHRLAALLCAALIGLLSHAQPAGAQTTTTPDYVTEDQIASLFSAGGSTAPVLLVEAPNGLYGGPYPLLNDGVPYYQPAVYGDRFINGGVITSAAYNLGNGLHLYAYEMYNGGYDFNVTTLSVPLGGAPLIPVGPVTTGAFSAGNYPAIIGQPGYGIPEPTFTGVLAPFWYASVGLPWANSTWDGITSFSASGAEITFTTLGAGGTGDDLVAFPAVTFATPVFGFITNAPPIVITGQFAADANGTLLQPAFQLVVPADPQLVDPVPDLLNSPKVTTG